MSDLSKLTNDQLDAELAALLARNSARHRPSSTTSVPINQTTNRSSLSTSMPARRNYTFTAPPSVPVRRNRLREHRQNFYNVAENWNLPNQQHVTDEAFSYDGSSTGSFPAYIPNANSRQQLPAPPFYHSAAPYQPFTDNEYQSSFPASEQSSNEGYPSSPRWNYPPDAAELANTDLPYDQKYDFAHNKVQSFQSYKNTNKTQEVTSSLINKFNPIGSQSYGSQKQLCQINSVDLNEGSINAVSYEGCYPTVFDNFFQCFVPESSFNIRGDVPTLSTFFKNYGTQFRTWADPINNVTFDGLFPSDSAVVSDIMSTFNKEITMNVSKLQFDTTNVLLPVFLNYVNNVRKLTINTSSFAKTCFYNDVEAALDWLTRNKGEKSMTMYTSGISNIDGLKALLKKVNKTSGDTQKCLTVVTVSNLAKEMTATFSSKNFFEAGGFQTDNGLHVYKGYYRKISNIASYFFFAKPEI